MHCPSCGQKTAIRAHRSHLGEYLISLIGIFPYYCNNCHIGFHRFRSRVPRPHIERWAHCPNCGFTGINRVSKDRVPRRCRNYWCRIIGVPSYRCPECRTKFFSIRPRKTKTGNGEHQKQIAPSHRDGVIENSGEIPVKFGDTPKP